MLGDFFLNEDPGTIIVAFIYVLGNVIVLLLFLWWLAGRIGRLVLPDRSRKRKSREVAAVTPVERYPPEMEGAIVEKSEAWISCLDPVPLHGRLDKAYLLKDGSILLVDTKTGGDPKVWEKDRIQLSVYATIVRRLIKKPGHPVRDYGYIRHVGRDGVVRWLRVDLMPEREIVWLWNAWHRARKGLERPRTTSNPGLCRRCGHRAYCPSPS